VALPPVLKTIVVPLERRAAFELFFRRIDTWWPLETRSASGRAVHCAVEERAGGRIYETTDEGEQVVWADILGWEEPAKVVVRWRVPGLPPTVASEVEVRFIELGQQTRVEIEHRDWERLGALATSLRGVYDGGWPGILARFEAVAAGEPLPGPPREVSCIDAVEAEQQRRRTKSS
jgi:uncharacterized protein YndB with AHSA1/START domain